MTSPYDPTRPNPASGPGPSFEPAGPPPRPTTNLYGQPVHGNPYGPYGAYTPASAQGVYGYQQPARSKTAAALLAFFLGTLGAHSFYLGRKALGLVHLGLFVGGWALTIIGGLMGPAAAQAGLFDDGYLAAVLFGWLLMMVNGLWALIEFVMILAKPEHELGR